MYTAMSQFHNAVFTKSMHDWMSIQGNEPYEVQELKYLLANIKCKCEKCDQNCTQRRRSPVKQAPPDSDPQADQTKRSVNRFVQATPKTAAAQTSQTTLTQTYNENVLCPTCIIAFKLLRGGLTKVYKDEESETVKTMPCDKATWRKVIFVERMTSMTSKLLSDSWKPSLSDFFTSQKSSGTSLEPSTINSRVRFKDEHDQEQPLKPAPHLQNPNCTCLESFIDSIRPPLIGY